MKIGIVTDTIASLSKEKIERLGIGVASIYINSDKFSLKDAVEIDNDKYAEYKKQGIKMKSSQPSPADFVTIYEDFISKGYTDIISIHPANCMSGTVNSARLGSEMVDGINIHIFEGKCGAFEQELQVDVTQSMIEAGKTPDEIIKKINEVREETENYLVIEELMALADTGRVSKPIARIGTAIKLKPVLRLYDDGFELEHKFRTSKKVINQIVSDITNYTEQNGKTVCYVSSMNYDDTINAIKKAFADNDLVKFVDAATMGPTLRVNFGAIGMGICWTKA